MALWALWSAPLLMSNDLRQVGVEYKQILTNKDLIAVNQDSLGILGRRVFNVWLSNERFDKPSLLNRCLALDLITELRNFGLG